MKQNKVEQYQNKQKKKREINLD